MPPKAQGSPKAQAQASAIPLGLTARDAEIALAAWMCLEADNKINAEKLATLTNIGKPESAARMFRMVKNKIESALPNATSNGNNGGGGPVATNAAKPTANKKKAAAGGGRKRAKRDTDTDDDASPDADASGKGGKPKKKAAKRAKQEHPEADTDMEAVDGDVEAGVA